MLKLVRHVPYRFRAQQVPDYDLGNSACALFLDLKYHTQRPTHIQRRMREVGASDKAGAGGRWALKILICLANKVSDPTGPLRDLSVIAIHCDFTLIVVWSDLEAALYIEACVASSLCAAATRPGASLSLSPSLALFSAQLVQSVDPRGLPASSLRSPPPSPTHRYKKFESKDASTITKRAETEHIPKLVDCLREIRGVNTSDVVTLSAAFGTLRGIMEASEADLALCPGVGPTKVQRLRSAFNTPF